MYTYVITLTHCTDETYRELICVCLDREIAETKANQLQKEKDPNFYEWRYNIEMVKLVKNL